MAEPVINGTPVIGVPPVPVLVAEILLTPKGRFRISTPLNPQAAAAALLAVVADIVRENMVDKPAPLIVAPVIVPGS